MTNIYGIKKRIHISQVCYITILYHKTKDIMLNKKDKNSKWRLSRMMYLIFTMIALLNIVVFPSISLFPFMWIPLLGGNGDKYFHQQKFDKMYYNNSYTFTVSLYTGYGFNWLFVFYTK